MAKKKANILSSPSTQSQCKFYAPDEKMSIGSTCPDLGQLYRCFNFETSENLSDSQPDCSICLRLKTKNK